MQEQNNAAADKHPENNIQKLEPLLRRGALDEFKRCLVSPVGHAVFVQLVKWALEYRAQTILVYLVDQSLSKIDGNSDKATGALYQKHGIQLFNLLYYDYAEFFGSSDELRKLRLRYLKIARIKKHKDLLLAAVNGDVEVFRKAEEIPEKLTKEFHSFVVYAAANDQVEVLRLFEGKRDFHSRDYYENAMAQAIKHNATLVFDYLIQMDFNPNYLFHNNQFSLVKLALQHRRFNQFVELVEKGATINDEIFSNVIAIGDELYIDYCESKNPKYPRDSFIIAIKNGHRHLIRFFLSKGLSLKDIGSYALCLAVMLNNLSIVKELLSLGVEIREKTSDGVTAILIAIACNNLVMLTYLINHLKTIITAEELSKHLNEIKVFNIERSAFPTGRPVIIDNSADMRKIFDLLVKDGATLIVKGNTAQGTNTYCLSYVMPSNQVSKRLTYLNLLAAKQLLEFKALTLDHYPITLQLYNYFINVNDARESVRVRPMLAAVMRCRHYLEAIFNFKDNLLKWDEKILRSLAYMIAYDYKSTISFFSTFIDELSKVNSTPRFRNVLPIIEILHTLPNGAIRRKICIAIADKLYSNAFLTPNTNFFILSTARYAYDAANATNAPEIDQKIANCIERGANLPLKCTPSGQHKAFMFNELINQAIKLQKISVLNDLLEGKIAQMRESRSHAITLNLFNEIISLCKNQENFLHDFINLIVHPSHSQPSNIILLCLLLSRNLDDKVTKLLGIYLKKLTQNAPRRLLILAHLLTYYTDKIAQPKQVVDIFYKALSELANVPFNGVDAFSFAIQINYKKILVAILTIRLELIKLVVEDCEEIKNKISHLNTQNDQEFAWTYQAIAQQIAAIIHDNFNKDQHRLFTTVLDQIENSCTIQLDYISYSEPTAAGKRPPTTSIETLEKDLPYRNL